MPITAEKNNIPNRVKIIWKVILKTLLLLNASTSKIAFLSKTDCVAINSILVKILSLEFKKKKSTEKRITDSKNINVALSPTKNIIKF